MNATLTTNRARLGSARNGAVATASTSRRFQLQSSMLPASPVSASKHQPGKTHGGQEKKRRTHWALGVWLLGVLACTTLVAGCGSKNSGNGARLEGAVTLDGNPITEGVLQFVPQQPSKAAPVSAQIKDGRYVVPAVPLGKVRVVVSASKKTGKMIKEYSTPYPEVVSIIPEKYRDGIEIEVTRDKSEQNIELTSR